LEYGFGPATVAEDQPATHVFYPIGQAIQFSLPVVFVAMTTRRLPRPARPHLGGMGLALAFGLAVAAGTLLLYYVFLRDTSVFADSPARIKSVLARFGADSPLGFVIFACFVTVPHSLLEEYYWRWFVFGRLRHVVARGWAIGLSSLGFAAFHVFPLNAYLSGHFFSAVLPFTACVAAGGAIWAWLYERTGSVYAPWLSHLIVDASLFVVGYDLFFVRGSV
ncbi:MAG TPA: CPBP family intramembrane glutamic endopeptidase, partial [Gemmataceae bacterium]|nr:CPBP family intramembrane glutamic endopeptidase [Gemmataceae bacterium]